MKKIFSLLIPGLFLLVNLNAQDVQQDQVKKEVVTKKKKFTKNTFQSSSIINMQDIEMTPKGNLQFMIAHHFGTIWNSDLPGRTKFGSGFWIKFWHCPYLFIG